MRPDLAVARKMASIFGRHVVLIVPYRYVTASFPPPIQDGAMRALYKVDGSSYQYCGQRAPGENGISRFDRQ